MSKFRDIDLSFARVVLVAAAVVIATASLLVSSALTRDLRREEQHEVEVWAEAMRTLNNADADTDLSLVLKIIDTNDIIPIIVLASNGSVEDSRNIRISASTAADSTAYLRDMAHYMQTKGNAIRIVIDDDAPTTEYVDVCYDDSIMLQRLRLYPFVQLGVVLIFVVVAIFALLTSKRAEQNKVWVGLSKETAHQLGTPISSLMAWTEVLKENYPADSTLPELERDVRRLQLIADRFSKIGSQPATTATNVGSLLCRVAEYMQQRTARTATIVCHTPPEAVVANLNEALFAWVIENLCKNAVDAIEGRGTITITLLALPHSVAIEVADTGRGIERKHFRQVFQPGYTTKQRGWGLGLSLARRIVEDYHQGRIFVKQSEPAKGTTFRIELKK